MADQASPRRNGPSRLLVGSFVLIGLLLAAGLGLPTYVRWKVRQKLPQGVSAGVIELHLSGVTLRKVQIDRAWIRGSLDEVWVSRDQQTVAAKGGSLDINLDKRPKEGSGSPEKRAVTATGLRVVLVRGEASADLLGGSWDGSRTCFEEGVFSHPKGKALVTGGCYDRPSGLATARTAKTHLDKLPAIPGLVLTEMDVLVADIEVRGTEKQLDVRAARFKAGPLSGEGLQLTVDDLGTNLKAQSLTVEHPWLSTGPTTFRQAHLALGVEPWAKGLPSGWAYINLSGDKKVGAKFDLAAQTVEGKAPCQDWLEAMPETLRVGPLRTLAFTGDLSFSVAMKPKPKLLLDARCKATCTLFPKLREKFTHTAYKADGTTFERTTGPGTVDWLSVGLMGKVPMAVINLEDPGYPYHRGYISEAFHNSLIDNVAKGKFARGGSTITQQTAKNLWLRREKTIGRKVAELFLAQAMESCMSKDEIIEVYLNIIEFGPDVYGLGPGSKHWFKKYPEALDPTEAFWLASILPAPRKTAGPTAAALKGTERLMESLAKQGKIPNLTGDVSDIDMTGWEQTP